MTDPLVTDHATLRSLAEAATPGLGTGDPVVVLFDYEEGGIVREADAAYIAACDPTTVIALLDELETLRAALPAEPWVASDDGERWQPLPEDHQAPDPTPQPAEAVAALVDILRAEFDQGHMMVMEPIAERILAALAPTVAASEAVEGDWMGPVVLSESRPATVREVPYVGVSFTDEDAPSPATEAGGE